MAVVVAGAYEDSTESVNPRVIKPMHAILDFSYKAQFPVHSNESLVAMAGDLEKYYSAVRVFIDNHACCSAKGMLIPHFRIPKHHNLRHFWRDIQDHGLMDNGSSEVIEALHIPHCKVTYCSTNKKGYTLQILDQLHCFNSLHIFASILSEGIGSDSGPPSLNYDEENSDCEAPDPDSGTWAALIQAQDQQMHSSCTAILSKWPKSTSTIEHMGQKASSPDLISTVVRFFQYNDIGL